MNNSLFSSFLFHLRHLLSGYVNFVLFGEGFLFVYLLFVVFTYTVVKPHKLLHDLCYYLHNGTFLLPFHLLVGLFLNM